jgi:hypothetical protein
MIGSGIKTGESKGKNRITSETPKEAAPLRMSGPRQAASDFFPLLFSF